MNKVLTTEIAHKWEEEGNSECQNCWGLTLLNSAYKICT
jgi:hypothetical protein